jgi:hypothetical protein
MNRIEPPLLVTLLAAGLAACGGPSSPPPEPAAPVAAPAPETSEPASVEAGSPAATDEDAARAAQDAALREREAALAQREAQLDEREAAAARTAQPKPTTRPATPAASAPAPAATPSRPAPAPEPPPPVTVPAGTQLAIELAEPLSSKTASVGDPVGARLAEDLRLDGRRVAKAGASVRGSLTEVVSGSRKIGARPLLRIEFSQLALADGTTAAISASALHEGPSERGRDTAKIIGGTAAGAIVGHQVDDDKGRVIGGILGGAAGAVAAHKTGTEAELPAGARLTASVASAFTYRGP